MTRALNPGEASQRRWGLQNDTQFHNRTYIGQIAGVDTQKGTMTVRIGVAGKQEDMVIPLVGVSANGAQSSWIRYMPQPNDFVKVAFGPDNRPQCVGMAVWGHEEDLENNTNRRNAATGYHIGGYARLTKLGADKAPGLREFSELRHGEWDMRSSGNAYIKGNRQGTLLLSGGTTKIELDRQRNELRSRASTTVINDGGPSTLRFGDVRRFATLVDSSPTKVAIAPLEAKEFAIHVESLGPVPGQLSQVDIRYGDVWDDFPTPIQAVSLSTAQPIRIRGKVAGATTLDVLTWTVDDLGNVEVSGLTAEMTTTFLNASHTALTAFNVTSPATTIEGTATLDLTGAAVNLNALGTADAPIVRGTDLVTWITNVVAAFAGHTHTGVTTGPGSSGTPATALPGAPATLLSATAKVK